MDDALIIRSMRVSDLSSGLRLSEQAGWNQTAADWERAFHLEPTGCWVAEQGGQVVGTTTVCHFDRVAWLALVLVDRSHRGKGIGSQLVERAIAYCDDRGTTAIRLDATPLGEPIYRKHGFVPQFLLERYVGTIAASWTKKLIPAEGDVLPEVIINLDERVTGTRRRELLQKLLATNPKAMECAGDCGSLRGFVLFRPGAHATYLGPAMGSPDVMPQLTERVFVRLAGQRVIVDIPQENHRARHCVEAAGLTVERQLLRMIRGKPVLEDLQWFWGSCGPEKG